LQHPELKDGQEDLSPEYFESSENREIFIAWQQVDDLPTLKEKLDIAIHEHLDSLINLSLPSNQAEQRYAEYTRRLRERYLKNLEAKRAEQFTLEVEAKGAGADLAKLEEEGIEPALRLKEIYTRKAKGGRN
jgi:endonuclease III